MNSLDQFSEHQIGQPFRLVHFASLNWHFDTSLLFAVLIAMAIALVCIWVAWVIFQVVPQATEVEILFQYSLLLTNLLSLSWRQREQRICCSFCSSHWHSLKRFWFSSRHPVREFRTFFSFFAFLWTVFKVSQEKIQISLYELSSAALLILFVVLSFVFRKRPSTVSILTLLVYTSFVARVCSWRWVVRAWSPSNWHHFLTQECTKTNSTSLENTLKRFYFSLDN